MVTLNLLLPYATDLHTRMVLTGDVPPLLHNKSDCIMDIAALCLASMLLWLHPMALVLQANVNNDLHLAAALHCRPRDQQYTP